MPKQIPDSELRVELMPRPGASWHELQRFALTFNGFQYWGSFERCGEIANSGRAQSLTELRTCLFFEQRRWRHFGEVPTGEDLAYMHSLLERIRAFTANSRQANGS